MHTVQKNLPSRIVSTRWVSRTLLVLGALLLSMQAQSQTDVEERQYAVYYEGIAGMNVSSLLSANSSPHKSVSTAITSLRGILHITSYRTAGREFYCLQLEKPQLILLIGRQLARTDQACANLCRPFFSTFTPSCQMRLRREQGVDDLSARLMSEILFRLPLRKPSGTRASVTGTDLNGSYAAHCSLQKGSLVITKTAYRLQPDAPVLRPDGSLRATYDNASRLTSVAADETLGGWVQGHNVSRSHISFTARLIHFNRKLADSSISPAFARSEDASPYALQQEATRNSLRQVLGSGCSDLLQDAQNADSLTDQERVRLLRRLEALFELSPDTPRAFASLIASKLPPVRGIVIEALAQCGSANAQNTLAQAILSNSANADVAVNLMVAAGELEKPAFCVENALRSLAARSNRNLPVRQMALFALGAIAKNMDPHNGRRKRILADLSNGLRTATSVDARSDFLLALGNTGSPPLGDLLYYAASGNVRLRQNALCALRYCADKPAVRILLQRELTSNANVSVRREAINSLAFHTSVSNFPLFCEAYRHEKEADLRILLLQCVACDLSLPKNVDTIVTAAHMDPCADVRKNAETILNAHRR